MCPRWFIPKNCKFMPRTMYIYKFRSQSWSIVEGTEMDPLFIFFWIWQRLSQTCKKRHFMVRVSHSWSWNDCFLGINPLEQFCEIQQMASGKTLSYVLLHESERKNIEADIKTGLFCLFCNKRFFLYSNVLKMVVWERVKVVW